MYFVVILINTIYFTAKNRFFDQKNFSPHVSNKLYLILFSAEKRLNLGKYDLFSCKTHSAQVIFLCRDIVFRINIYFML